MSAMSLDGEVCRVTGAARGIGNAIAAGFARGGGKVAVAAMAARHFMTGVLIGVMVLAIVFFFAE